MPALSQIIIVGEFRTLYCLTFSLDHLNGEVKDFQCWPTACAIVLVALVIVGIRSLVDYFYFQFLRYIFLNFMLLNVNFRAIF